LKTFLNFNQDSLSKTAKPNGIKLAGMVFRKRRFTFGQAKFLLHREGLNTFR
jgi:hypothetical protein